MTGRLIGIARAAESLAPLETVERVRISIETGVEGDCRGIKPDRQISILFRDGWEDACRDAGAELPWLTRRANLYVEGLDRPREAGGRIVIGEVVLEVAEETRPCALMEAAFAGLRAAMRPDWRGGVLCRVIEGGEIALGDRVSAELAPTAAA
jgi:MOSC domain-containing protein YiiM